MNPKPRVVKSGCFWIVLRHGHPVYEWSYNRVHDTWSEAIEYSFHLHFWFKTRGAK